MEKEKTQTKSKEENLEPYLLFEKSPNNDREFITRSCLDISFCKNTSKIMQLGEKNKLNFQNLYRASKSLEYDRASPIIENLVKEDLKREESKRKGFRTLMRLASGSNYTIGFITSTIPFLIQIPIPILVKGLIAWVGDPGAENKTGYYLALGLSFISFLKTYFEFMSGYFMIHSYEETLNAGRVSK